MTNTIYWIDGPWAGRLAILARPRGGARLPDDVRAWQHASFHAVVSLLTAPEAAKLGLADEATLAAQQDMQFFTLPIPDRDIPFSFHHVRELVETGSRLLLRGSNIGVHCGQGVGRSALLAASLLVHAGMDADTAFARIEAARGCYVPDTARQRQWVEQFATYESLPIF